MASLSLLSPMRNHLAAVGAALVGALIWRASNQLYVAIVVGNVVYLGLFALADFAHLLNLKPLEEHSATLMSTAVNVVDQSGTSKCHKIATGALVFEVRPATFKAHQDFANAFNLNYVADDTRKFVASLRERVRTSFFIALASGLFLMVVFQATSSVAPAQQPTPAASASAGQKAQAPASAPIRALDEQTATANPANTGSAVGSEVTDFAKTVIALALALLNALNILRVFWFYRERNSALVK